LPTKNKSRSDQSEVESARGKGVTGMRRRIGKCLRKRNALDAWPDDYPEAAQRTHKQNGRRIGPPHRTAEFKPVFAHAIPAANDSANSHAGSPQISLGIVLMHVRPIPIGAPFFDIASHLETEIRRATVGEGVYRTRRLVRTVTAPPAKPFRVPFIAPRKNPPIAAAGGSLPLDLGWEP